jgi:large conductance mechanosensitive channel
MPAVNTEESVMLEDFKKFALRGNVVDMAVGIVIGAAFGLIVKSLVADLIMPPIGLLLGGVDFTNIFTVLKEGATPGPYNALADAQAAGAVTINWGLFINTILNFLIVAGAIFMVVRMMSNLQKKEEAAPTTKECGQCKNKVAIAATRCGHCTSQLAGA